MRGLRIALAVLLGCLLASAALAQEKPAQKPAEPAAAQPRAPEQHKTGEPAQTEKATGQVNAQGGGMGEQLAETSREAAGEDEHGEFKHSASVGWIAHVTGLSLGAAYWVAIIFNFTLIALLIGWGVKAKVPQMLRGRTEGIQKGLKEAQRSSEEATARLSEIESRLARLDGEIAAMRAAADADAAAEEERIRADAELDKRKVVEGAGQEIEAAARQAQRELKAYAASLAVSLAAKRIQVDANADRYLVHSFVDQLADADGGERRQEDN
jgi:F-type H+-transporting ATPase subunit b